MLNHNSTVVWPVLVALTLAARPGYAESPEGLGTVVGKIEMIAEHVSTTGEVIGGESLVPRAGATLQFSNDNTTYETRTDNRGEYAVSLAADRKYHVVVEGFGACNLSRAAFSLARNQRVVLNFIGVVCPFIDTDVIPLPSELPAPIGPEHHSPCMTSEGWPFGYREQTMAADVSTQRPEVVISYGSCKEDQLGIAYANLDPDSLLSQRKRSGPGLVLLQVTITAGTYTIRADQVIFNRKGMTFTATGNVLVEDGTGNSSHLEAVTLSFVKGTPIITPATPLPISVAK